MMRFIVILITLVMLSINTTSSAQQTSDDDGVLQQESIKMCRADNKDAAEVQVAVDDTSITLGHRDWSEVRVIIETAKGRLDFEDMRLTIRDAKMALVFVKENRVIIAQPFPTFGKPNCFITSHQLQ